MRTGHSTILLLVCSLVYALGFGPTLHRLHDHGPAGCGPVACAHAHAASHCATPGDADDPRSPDAPTPPMDDCQTCTFLAVGRDADVPPAALDAIEPMRFTAFVRTAAVRFASIEPMREAAPRGPPARG